MVQRVVCLLLPVSLVVCSCQSKEQSTSQSQGGGKMEIKLTSKAFKEGATIPKQYTCDGKDVSPPLEWDKTPDGTKSLALICDDPDAPMGTWVHWVVYNLPAHAKKLAAAIPPKDKLPNSAVQGTNDFHKIGYGGPCPPRGTHRYFFKLYALDTALDLKPGATKTQLEIAMEGHVVGRGQLIGRYSR
ncbi:MAG: phosphatidylethanolamine-binding protein [Armatimonadetes bacterium CG2_30_59_28]|nr:YbhB/YbcL family Raf kinase inhibitor-like protein [Armatimonadota bacterium]OIO98864.1 MAG: phosphatidylethanolamine-binding protein [Armatimonadetes bacterium CG2_30_59_28]PIU60954.1 MAG: YbhB/YbcL family Raf kinase inhibitor-like protein [Armatimonadetes bacterium CG07_land_8_20_14_0_80_59_28]PIX41086.1 MAG: YbhB/YbcL family Raf kinase inhibitor-like protein [Armatimonadetes bacterium CG_4_8_14_3_um_filter_58_9]PIY40006.1 MAG: YbhB/YbcL family Raf kinase inhibitor-like protein [Armatimona